MIVNCVNLLLSLAVVPSPEHASAIVKTEQLQNPVLSETKILTIKKKLLNQKVSVIQQYVTEYNLTSFSEEVAPDKVRYTCQKAYPFSSAAINIL